ncbi:MAG: hypothetical protein QMD23_05825 [Candidatus Bathyarchaeia archaeon]|nr:hypothetical protein [Candidatus Bathyarchaeota archaeon]MDI6847631.1 hypothetical protein [Candidatus Bathyarchaeia archaeon]
MGPEGVAATIAKQNWNTSTKALFHEGKLEEFHVKIAQTPEEIKELLEVGFEYVCEKDGLLFFRKQKRKLKKLEGNS